MYAAVLVAFVIVAAVLVFCAACRGERPPPEAFHAARGLEDMLAAGVPVPSVVAIDPAQVLLVKYRARPIGIVESYGAPQHLHAFPVPGLDQDAGAYRDSGVTPSQFSHGGLWPPGMYTRMRQWQPGFGITTGWSWGWRPGVEVVDWPRSRWVANNGNYYFINNYQRPEGEVVY